MLHEYTQTHTHKHKGRQSQHHDMLKLSKELLYVVRLIQEASSFLRLNGGESNF